MELRLCGFLRQNGEKWPYFRRFPRCLHLTCGTNRAACPIRKSSWDRRGQKNTPSYSPHWSIGLKIPREPFTCASGACPLDGYMMVVRMKMRRMISPRVRNHHDLLTISAQTKKSVGLTHLHTSMQSYIIRSLRCRDLTSVHRQANPFGLDAFHTPLPCS